MIQKYKLLRCFILFFCLGIGYASPVLAQWVQTNGPYGAHVRALVATPGGTLFAALGTYGVYCSTDGGKSWTAVNTGMADVEVTCLTIAPDDSTLFAGTSGDGVFRSTDDGESWTLMNSGLAISKIYSLAASPDDSTLYVGTYGEYGQGEVYRFDGTSWSQIDQTGIFGIVGSMVVSPDDSTILATLVTGSDVYRSTDYGTSWSPIALVPGLASPLAIVVAVSPVGATVFAGTAGHGVYRSTDNGASWSQINAGLTDSSLASLAVSPDGKTLIAGTFAGAFYYNGTRWTQAGLTDFEVNSLLVFPHESIFAATLGGIFHTTDIGESWNKADSTMIRTTGGTVSLAADPDGPTIAAGTGTGVFLTTNDGANWTHIGYGGDYNEVAFSSDGKNLYALGQYSISHFVRSGSGWIVSSPISDDNSYDVIAVARGDTLFAGTGGYGVYRYNGTSWYQAGLINYYITSLAITPDGSTIFAGTYSNGVFRSTDDGNSWTNADTGLTNMDISAFAVSPDGAVFAGTSVGVFRSTDKASSWAPINAGLTEESVSSLQVTTDGSMLFAGTGDGMFWYDGKSWSRVDTTGLGNNRIVSFAVSSDGSTAFAGTMAAGVWKRSVAELTPIETKTPIAPEHFALSQNYPNPFNPTTVIRYRLSSAGKVTLRVYDMLGREVATLVNRREGPGTYDVRFDGSRFASGVYFYRIKAGKYRSVRKMLLLK